VALDELYDAARASAPYRNLPRRQFDLVVEMLAGRYEEARIAELKPRLAVDRLTGEARARPGTVRLLAQAGGTIPDRGYFQLRTEETNARLGELDEEFVWERSLGDVFLLGTQSWRIRRITANEVFVSPARGGTPLAPFWRADGRNRGAVFSERIAALLERLDGRLDDPSAGRLAELERELREEDGLDSVAAAELVRQLHEAKAALGGALPHRRRIVFEEVPEAGVGVEGSEAARHRQLLLYTFWGGTLNRPLAMALAAAFEEAEGYPAESYADDDAVLLRLPAGVDPRALLARVGSERIEELLRTRLEGSGLFGAQFRQNAQRALLLPRAAPGRRTPLWLSRESAKRLLEAVARFDDFPVTLESWRSTLRDELDLPGLREKLEALEAGAIEVGHVRSDRPSPLASGLLWKHTNDLVYEDDVPAARRGASLRADLVREVALGERPPIPRALVERYRRKVQRLLPGYAPQGAGELLEWVKERLYLPTEEWDELVAAIERDEPGAAAPAVAELEAGGKLTRDGGGVLAREALGRRDRASAGRFEEWLRYQPPLALSEAARRWGVAAAELESMLAPLIEGERVVVGRISEGAAGAESEVSTVDAVRTLLRWRRAAARPELEPAPLARLPLFVATWQGLADRGSGPEALQAALDRLFGYTAPAALWESELLPARLDGYLPGLLDALFDESPLRFFGDGRERIGFAFASDLDLFPPARESGGEAPEAAANVRAALAAAPRGLDLEELLERSQLGSSAVVPALWDLVWRGELAGDAMRLVRQGIDHQFAAAPAPRPDEAAARGAGGRRGLVRRWQLGRVSLGRWHPRPRAHDVDPIAEAEASRELARLLLERYGVLFRELVAGELPGQWGRIFRALRTLELSGEILAGSFFHGVPGIQFALPSAVEALRDGGATSAIWWCSAVDPASFCGTALDGLRPLLPRRVASNRLVYRGATPVATLRRGGAEIELHVAPDDRDLGRIVEPLRVALTRAVAPERAVDVETVNGEPAAMSPYRRAFDAFDTARLAGDALRLRRRYGSAAFDEAEGAERIVSHVEPVRLGSVERERNDTR
jgi:ATP-dependent Lhr-like helicase